MKLNKSPGLDDLSVELYRTFWDKLKYFLIKTYNKSYKENLLTYLFTAFKCTSITIWKGGSIIIGPISLLNVDLKILSNELD